MKGKKGMGKAWAGGRRHGQARQAMPCVQAWDAAPLQPCLPAAGTPPSHPPFKPPRFQTVRLHVTQPSHRPEGAIDSPGLNATAQTKLFKCTQPHTMFPDIFKTIYGESPPMLNCSVFFFLPKEGMLRDREEKKGVRCEPSCKRE